MGHNLCQGLGVMWTKPPTVMGQSKPGKALPLLLTPQDQALICLQTSLGWLRNPPASTGTSCQASALVRTPSPAPTTRDGKWHYKPGGSLLPWQKS